MCSPAPAVGGASPGPARSTPRYTVMCSVTPLACAGECCATPGRTRIQNSSNVAPGSSNTSRSVAVTAAPRTSAAAAGGSPGFRTRAVSGTHSAPATAYNVSSVGLRVPCSSPDSVALPMPAERASADSESPRAARIRRSRSPTAGSPRLVVPASMWLLLRSVYGTIGGGADMRPGGTLPTVLAGLVSALVGYASSFTVVLAGLRAVGATPAQAASGLLAVCLAIGATAIGLSLRYRMPIAIAWSTPGAALLAATGPVPGGFPAAVGAFLLSAGLMVLAGLLPWLTR